MIRQYLETCIIDNWMPESKFKIVKYTFKAIVLSFLSQFFSNCGPLKKRYISKIYSEGPQEHPETIHRHKTQNINAKHLQCQCIVSGCSCGPLPYIFEIYLFFFSGPAWKNWIRKLRTIALHVYFRVLNFNTTSNYQLCTFLNIVLCL